jgi:hypothetical protein
MESKTRYRPEYWQQYWAKNKERILEERKFKYKHDPAYKASILRNSAKRREETKVGRKQPSKDRVLPSRTQEFKVDKVSVECHSIGELATRTGYTSATLHEWVGSGLVPRPTVIDTFGRMWFSPMYIQFLDDALDRCRGEAWSREVFGQRVKEMFVEQYGAKAKYTI